MNSSPFLATKRGRLGGGDNLGYTNNYLYSQKRNMPHRNPTLIEIARQMRSNPTSAEAKLWQVLRKRQILNTRFRRQHPIDPYIVDFCAPRIKLIIEVDGGQHIGLNEYDKYRTDYLNEKGYHVLRFWNNQVMNDLDGVVLEIISFVQEHINH